MSIDPLSAPSTQQAQTELHSQLCDDIRKVVAPFHSAGDFVPTSTDVRWHTGEVFAERHGIVVVSLSGAMSATMQSAELAARSVSDEIPVRVVDSRSVTMGLGTIVLSSARLAAEGASLDEVEAFAVDRASKTRVFGALDTLENLKKGGRIGNAKALLATALAIKPIIEVIDGQVEQGGKQRTRSKALKFLVEKVREYEGQISDLAVMHADCSDVDQFVEMVRSVYDGEIVVGEIGPVVGTHAGRGTIGVAFDIT